MTSFPEWLRVPSQHFNLSEMSSKTKLDRSGKKIKRKEASAMYLENIEALKQLQFKMWAEKKTSLLVVFQAMDTGGKDGAIRKCFGPLNPQGVKTQAFKVPTAEEASHDFLWRIHQHTPAKGMVQIFNRSHYEDVLVVRVHDYVPEEVWKKRYDHINQFEQLLVDSNTIIIKFMLHISLDEQKERLQERLDDPTRHWKFSSGDLKERKLWPQYMEAFHAALERTSKDHAPWYVIPSDRKWYRNYAITTIVRETLESIEMSWPDAEDGLDKIIIE